MSNTAANLHHKAFIRMKDEISIALMLRLPSFKMNEILPDLFRAHPKLRQWDKAYFEGYYKAVIDELYRNRLTHGGFYNGRFYSTDSSRSDYYGHCGIAPEYWHSANNKGHYWLEADRHCDGSKPFFNASMKR